MLLSAALRKYVSFGRVHGLTASPAGQPDPRRERRAAPISHPLQKEVLPLAHSGSAGDSEGAKMLKIRFPGRIGEWNDNELTPLSAAIQDLVPNLREVVQARPVADLHCARARRTLRTPRV
eukprot:gene21468-biopygen2659